MTGNRGQMAADLRALALNMLETADQLNAPLNQPNGTVRNVFRPRYEHATLAACAARLYAMRRARAGFLSADLLGEPAWDMLLDLYVMYHRGRPISVTSACLAAMVPPTTALRWVRVLEDQGLIRAVPNPQDNRGRLLRLTSRGEETMSKLLENILDRERGSATSDRAVEDYLIRRKAGDKLGSL